MCQMMDYKYNLPLFVTVQILCLFAALLLMIFKPGARRPLAGAQLVS